MLIKYENQVVRMFTGVAMQIAYSILGDNMRHLLAKYNKDESERV